MNKLELQKQMMDYVCNVLSYASGFNWEKRDVTNFPPTSLLFQLDNGVHISLEFVCDNADKIDIDDLENVPVSLYNLGIRNTNITLEDLYNIIDGIEAVTKKKYSIYLHSFNVNEKVENVINLLSVDLANKSSNNTIEFDRATLEKLDKAAKNGTLSAVNLYMLDKIDKKYRGFLVSRGALIYGNIALILDNEE